MKNFRNGILFLIVTTVVTLAIASCAGVSLSKARLAQGNSLAASTKKRMHAFRSDQEIKSYFRELAAKQQRERGREDQQPQSTPSATSNSTAPAQAAPADKAGALASKG